MFNLKAYKKDCKILELKLSLAFTENYIEVFGGDPDFKYEVKEKEKKALKLKRQIKKLEKA